MSKTEISDLFKDVDFSQFNQGNGQKSNESNALINEPDRLKKELEAEEEAKKNSFPIEAFPEQIQEIAKATNESLNFPIDFIGASLLYAISVSIGNTYRVQLTNGFLQSAVLYMAMVGRPGTNKTAPLQWALKPLEQRDNLKFKEYEQAKQEYETNAALSKKEREEQGYGEPVKPAWEQLLISDFTPEALASIHSYNKRGLGVNVDELASWFKNFNRYNKGSEQEFWLSAWSGNTIKINRKTSEPINIPIPFISVAGTIQPGILNELAQNRTENGFLDRLLFINPDSLEKPYWRDTELSPEISENWQTVISNLLALPLKNDEAGTPQPEVLRFTPEARQLIFDWQRDITDLSNKPKNEAITGIYAKLEMYAIRLALCLEMARFSCGEGNGEAVGLKAVEGALQLVEYFNNTALEVHSIVNNSSPLDKLPTDKQDVYKALPDQFSTIEGVQIAERLGMPGRTFQRFIKNKELFDKIQRGQYEKRL